MDPFPIIVMCTDQPDLVIPGSWYSCHGCGLRVFMGDSSIRAVEAQGYFKEDIQPHCFACVRKSNPKLDEMLAFSDEQKKEITEGLRKFGIKIPK